MRYTSFIALLLLFVKISNAQQTQVFLTYDDFINGNGITMDENYISSTESTFGMTIKFKTPQGESKNYKPKEMWGFYYKNHLFRSVGKEIAMLSDTGKVNLYLNGIGSMYLLKDPDRKSATYLSNQSSCYLSIGELNAKIYRMPFNRFEKRDLKDFKKDFPEFENLHDCLAKSYGNYEVISKCVMEFNSAGKR